MYLRYGPFMIRRSSNVCARKSALDSIESHPSRYRAWVDTKAHQGELRGKLFAGMAHM
jgi:hypothetical protein